MLAVDLSGGYLGHVRCSSQSQILVRNGVFCGYGRALTQNDGRTPMAMGWANEPYAAGDATIYDVLLTAVGESKGLKDSELANMKKWRHDKAAQPRSSEKNAASRAGQTPCTRLAVTISLLEQKAPTTAENRAFEEKQPLVFLPKAANSWIHGGVRPPRREVWSWRRRWGEGSQGTALYD